MKLAKIIWRDSCSYDGWKSVESIDLTLPEIKTVGLIIDDEGDMVTLCHTLAMFDGTPRANGILQIPKQAIDYIEIDELDF